VGYVGGENWRDEWKIEAPRAVAQLLVRMPLAYKGLLLSFWRENRCPRDNSYSAVRADGAPREQEAKPSRLRRTPVIARPSLPSP